MNFKAICENWKIIRSINNSEIINLKVMGTSRSMQKKFLLKLEIMTIYLLKLELLTFRCMPFMFKYMYMHMAVCIKDPLQFTYIIEIIPSQ